MCSTPRARPVPLTTVVHRPAIQEYPTRLCVVPGECDQDVPPLSPPCAPSLSPIVNLYDSVSATSGHVDDVVSVLCEASDCDPGSTDLDSAETINIDCYHDSVSTHFPPRLGELNSPAKTPDDFTRPVVTELTSPLGQKVTVYNCCVMGTCDCCYFIGGIRSQLKPCRFGSLILGSTQEFYDKYIDLLWYITDGCPIVDSPVEPYECRNYLSITCPENSPKMDLIISRELKESMVSKVNVKPTCIHALGAVPKGNGGIRQITDCSRPEGLSVNSHCTSLLKEFCFKNVDNVVDVLESGDFMTIVDIKAAYRSVPIRADHRVYQGFRWTLNGHDGWFQDNRLSFGLRLGPMYFNYVSTFIYDVLTDKGLKVVNYLDDFIAVAPSYQDCILAQEVLVSTLRFLGFHVAFDKLVHPSNNVTYLGIEIDSVNMELRLPQNKLFKLRELLDIAVNRKRISRKELESLGGHLSHCSHVVRGGRIFCRSVYALYKTMIKSNKRFVTIPDWVRADLQWWLKLCVMFNGTSKMVKECYHHAMVSDSSLKGFGVYLGQDWCAGTWHDEDCINLASDCTHVCSKPLVDKFDDKNINVLELWPVLIGLKRWAPMLRNMSLIVYTDNTQVLFMLLNGKSSNVTCMHWIRELFWTCAFYNIDLIPKYINTVNNLVADTLSRIPYSNVSCRLNELLGGSELCCLNLLFANYRKGQGSVEGSG